MVIDVSWNDLGRRCSRPRDQFRQCRVLFIFRIPILDRLVCDIFEAVFIGDTDGLLLRFFGLIINLYFFGWLGI